MERLERMPRQAMVEVYKVRVRDPRPAVASMRDMREAAARIIRMLPTLRPFYEDVLGTWGGGGCMRSKAGRG
jgi:hypothetical protein